MVDERQIEPDPEPIVDEDGSSTDNARHYLHDPNNLVDNAATPTSRNRTTSSTSTRPSSRSSG